MRGMRPQSGQYLHKWGGVVTPPLQESISHSWGEVAQEAIASQAEPWGRKRLDDDVEPRHLGNSSSFHAQRIHR